MLFRSLRRRQGLLDRADDDVADVADAQPVLTHGRRPALEHLDTPEVRALFGKAAELGKVIGAICISPVVLAHAGLLNGKTVTCWPDGAPEVEKGGGKYTGAEVETDGRLITASGPVAARKYGQALAGALKEEE